MAKYAYSWIDSSVTDKDYDADDVTFPAFIAGTLMEMVNSKEYMETPSSTQLSNFCRIPLSYSDVLSEFGRHEAEQIRRFPIAHFSHQKYRVSHKNRDN